MGKLIDLTDQRFGALTVIARDGTQHRGRAQYVMWLCRCDCGAYKVYRAGHLRLGYVVTCGDRKTHPRVRVPVMGYNQAHARLRRLRGSASAHPCCICGGEADSWAYLRGDPGEIVTEGGVPYSLNIWAYWPMCASDHRMVDQPLPSGDLVGAH